MTSTPADDPPITAPSRGWFAATLLVFAVAAGAMIFGSVGAGWGALGMAMVVNPIANIVIATVSAAVCWYRDGRFSRRLLVPFALAVLATVIVFLAAASVGGGGC